MGYRVLIKVESGRQGYLQRGSFAPAWGIGTYYHHPSGARVAAKSWLKKHPTGTALIVTFKDGTLVEKVIPA